MAPSLPTCDPDDPVYACLVFMPQMFKLCVCIFSVYTLPPITVIFKENLLHCPSSLSTFV